MKTRTANVTSLLGTLIVWCVALAVYRHIPASVPTHWNLATGEPGGYVPRIWGVLLFTALPLIPYFLFKIIVWISPQGFRMESFERTINILSTTLTTALAIGAAAGLLAASGVPVPIVSLVPIVAGATLMAFGNYYTKVRKNFFIGIRVPWTLASDEVWFRTHRLAGWLIVLAGGSVIFAGFNRGAGSVTAMVALILASVIVPVVYSFVIYCRVEGFHKVHEQLPEE